MSLNRIRTEITTSLCQLEEEVQHDAELSCLVIVHFDLIAGIFFKGKWGKGWLTLNKEGASALSDKSAKFRYIHTYT